MNDLTIGKPLQQIIKFAIPMMIGNLVQQFYNIVDAIVVGQVVGSEGLAAVSEEFVWASADFKVYANFSAN